MMKKKKAKKEQPLSKLYYTSHRPGAYGGVQALKRYTTLKPSEVKNWLSFQDAYTLHKPVRKKFARRRVVVGGIDQQWQADLIDVQRLKKDNDGYSYLLTVIDVFSKYAWVVPLKNKNAQNLVGAFEDIFKKGRKPLKLQTDKGTEFLNRRFQQFLKQNRVEFFVTQNEDIKAGVVERFNRTLKQKLWRYFTKKNTTRYREALSPVVRGYNHTYHRSIKTAPSKVNLTNQEEVWQTLYGNQERQPSIRPLKAGDRVRISKAKKTFKKGYLASWSEELFTVSRVKNTLPTTYVLKDDHGDEIIGAFYHQEIQKVGDKDIFRVETILKERPAPHGQSDYLVKWYGYPPRFNSWIPKKALVKYTD